MEGKPWAVPPQLSTGNQLAEGGRENGSRACFSAQAFPFQYQNHCLVDQDAQK